MNIEDKEKFNRLIDDARCILELAINEEDREKRITIITSAMNAAPKALRLAGREAGQ